MMSTENRLRGLPFRVGVEIQNDAMAQHRRRHRFDVFGGKMQPAFHQRQHAPAFDQRLRAARRAAVADELVGQLVRLSACPAASPSPDRSRNPARAAPPAHGGTHRAAPESLRDRAPCPRSTSSLWMVRSTIVLRSAARRIPHQDLHQEPVELRFGKRIGSFHLDRILRRHHQKRRLQLMRRRAAGDGVLLHRFEQRRLRLRRRAIDFVRQHQVRENRPGLKSAAPSSRPRCR